MKTYFLISLIPLLVLLIMKTKKVFQMLQQNYYNVNNRYFRWVIRNRYKIFSGPEMFFVILLAATYFLPSTVSMILYFLFYLLISIFFYHAEKKEQVKIPLVYTKRIFRLALTFCLLLGIMIVPMLFTNMEHSLFFHYTILSLFCYLDYLVALALIFLTIPVEKMVFLHYKRLATKKLEENANMKVIGITGSYGKTSSKNILNTILNVKYVSFPTPKNFNTTYGMINTLNNYLDKFNDYFIAEMGAFKRGEIKEICDFIKPTYGILTTIGTAHLETFGSIENIQKGKFELIESLPKDGIGILNRDDPYQVSYPLKNDCKILWIGIDNKEADLYATNIELSGSGTSFDCIWKGDSKPYHFETKLLGTHNIYNLLAGILLGHELGISIPELQIAVSKVSPVEHRLELKEYGNLHLIDDAYNSNPVGSKRALEVLSLMKGKRIIVTPGMIELGSLQYIKNKEFGEQIAGSVDEVILIGKEQTIPIYDGLKEMNFKQEHIHILNDVKEAFPLMKKLSGEKETYVLLENDLPDIFNE